MPRSPLTETYEKVNDIFQTINALEPDQRNLLLDWLFPEPEPAKKPQKKSSKKPAGKGGGGKSKHASSLESAIKGGCVATLASTGKPCGMARPHVIHSDHNQDIDAHDFLSAAQLNKSLQGQRHVAGDGIRCIYQYPQDSPVNAGLTCDEGGDNGIHDPTMGYAGYHEFVAPPATHAATGD